MMIGETHYRSNPTVQIPPWDYYDDPTPNIHSPFSVNHNSHNNSNAVSPKCFDALTALQRYLPSNINDVVVGTGFEDCDIPVDTFSCDNFRIYEFKVRRCARARSHDWTECPYAHPGEKARRRDPRKFHYSGVPCPDFRKGQCVRGDACEYAHGVFECWLHPARYRTQPCKDGTFCRRKICFFAHTPDQLRLSHAETYCVDSPSRLAHDSLWGRSSPTSTLYSPPSSPPTNESPPLSPCAFNSVSELVGSMRGMQIGNGGSSRLSLSPTSRCVSMGSGFGSPRTGSTLRSGFTSVPCTPTRRLARSGLGVFELWEQSCEEEPVMERVESGRDLRAKIYGKLSKENSLSRVDSSGSGPAVGWASELVK